MRRGTNNKVGKLGQIRIISGQWRGRKLPVLDAEGLRPTTDRTKETLFNWLAPYISGSHCLDMFAGSGSLGIEALSRYAEYCHFCELNPQAGKLIRDNLATLGLDQDKYRVELGNGLEKISTCNDPFDVIFIDPPFNQNLAEKAISMIVNGHLLKVGGVLYVETELNASLASLPASWHCIKQRHTKTMSYCLYTHAT